MGQLVCGTVSVSGGNVFFLLLVELFLIVMELSQQLVNSSRVQSDHDFFKTLQSNTVPNKALPAPVIKVAKYSKYKLYIVYIHRI